ncbi:hypothetical protein LAZ67_13001699 [Cordylochernes scorpioides]|uniref:Uncharacterized protein n=1 Tax=Cordylochernes scorpioides TaxID=51811 RepID=A0ABY6L4H5_9ARAC|nr:hypothetical protein LAZ67_13001699 [Cordylochernes scorpioides]
MPHPTYCPDLTPSDFDLFGRLERRCLEGDKSQADKCTIKVAGINGQEDN